MSKHVKINDSIYKLSVGDKENPGVIVFDSFNKSVDFEQFSNVTLYQTKLSQSTPPGPSLNSNVFYVNKTYKNNNNDDALISEFLTKISFTIGSVVYNFNIVDVESIGLEWKLTTDNPTLIVTPLVPTGTAVTLTGKFGGVVITGDLLVQGETTTINTVNLDVEDKIITLNKGEKGTGVSESGKSGIRIDRGDAVDAQILFNENISAFELSYEDGTLAALQTNFIQSPSSDLVLDVTKSLSAQPEADSGLIRIASNIVNTAENYAFRINPNLGSNDPEDEDPLVIQYDAVPNVKYVESRVRQLIDLLPSPIPNRIQDEDSQLLISDFQSTLAPSRLTLRLDNTISAEFYTDRVELQDFRISGTKIETTVSNADLVLSNQGIGSVVIDGNFRLNNQLFDTPASPDGLRLYAKESSTKDAGLYYVNSNNDRGELISRRKALAYSIIF